MGWLIEPATDARVGDRLPYTEPFQDLIGAIAIVHVEVEDQHALHHSFREQLPRRDHESVERAVSARRIIVSVMKAAHGRASTAGGQRGAGSHACNVPLLLAL